MSKNQPKKIVYLIGAGATQAEVTYRGAAIVNLLMGDRADLGGDGVSTGVLNSCGPSARDLVDQTSVDIEKIISLLSASAVSELVDMSESLRESYFGEIKRRLVKAKIVSGPRLAKALFQMHCIEPFQRTTEVLSGILTTNHDGLLQIASQEVFGGVNLGFPYRSNHFKQSKGSSIPPVIQLHGSFTWRFSIPISVSKLYSSLPYDQDTVWIPPTVLKEPKDYPFGKLVAIAYELLSRECDVLRIVGASLTQNDWNILSLIFNGQRHRILNELPPFKVELITSHDGGERIKRECSYLKNLFSLGYLTDGHFAQVKDDDPYRPPDPESTENPFAFWLKEKAKYHKAKGDFGGGPYGDMIDAVLGE